MVSILLKRALDYLIQLIREIVTVLFKALLDGLYIAWYKFLSISIPEKIITLNIFASLVAVMLPVARFFIFDSYTNISNPAGVYLLGILILVIISYFLRSIPKLALRTGPNAVYLIWMIYLYFSNGLTKANPFEIRPGFYLNLIVPSIFIAVSLISFYLNED